MKSEKDIKIKQLDIYWILVFGALWGIFEATAGYLLHLLPISTGWLVWYPAACFFMGITYLKTLKTCSVFIVALISAGIKLFNLLLPVRIDMVINPAVSILLEALAFFCAVLILQKNTQKRVHIKALVALIMNTGWRALYILYAVFLMPAFMRDISVISSGEQIVRFLIVENIATSVIIFLAYLVGSKVLSRRLKPASGVITPAFTNGKLKAVAIPLLFCAAIALQLFL